MPKGEQSEYAIRKSKTVIPLVERSAHQISSPRCRDLGDCRLIARMPKLSHGMYERSNGMF